MKAIVVDASIILKVYLDETDTEQALDFIDAATNNYWSLFAPSLLQYEVADVAMRKKHDMDRFGAFYEKYIGGLINQESPNRETWIQANEITRVGHDKSGYPTSYDSIYHAMAIVKGGIFITADHSHYAKAKEFGHIVMLSDWESIFDDRGNRREQVPD